MESQAIPLHICIETRPDEKLTLETSALRLFTVANLHYQLSWYNQIILLKKHSYLSERSEQRQLFFGL